MVEILNMNCEKVTPKIKGDNLSAGDKIPALEGLKRGGYALIVKGESLLEGVEVEDVVYVEPRGPKNGEIGVFYFREPDRSPQLAIVVDGEQFLSAPIHPDSTAIPVIRLKWPDDSRPFHIRADKFEKVHTLFQSTKIKA